MKLSKEQIKTISSSILISDIISYVDNHREEYEEFLKNENNEDIS